MDKLYTVQEAAEILRVRRDTVYSLVKRGQLPVVKLGRTIRIPESAFHATGNTGPEKSESPGKRPVIMKIRP